MGGSTPAGKDQTKYLPVMYRGLRYPRLARNALENREQVARRLNGYASWNTGAALSLYRTFRPRFLNYLVKVERDGRTSYECERRPVGPNDLTPFVMVCYSSAHYRIPDKDESGGPGGGQDDLETLLSVAIKATFQHFSPLPSDLQQNPRAFWTAANCMPANEVADENGEIRSVEGFDVETLVNQDVGDNTPIPNAHADPP